MKEFVLRRLIPAIVVVASAAMTAGAYAAGPRGWEPVRAERSDARAVVREPELEIKVASRIIFVTTSHPVQIQIFTILGRLVSSETLPAGKSQLQLPSSGIYVVKAGELTCKIAV